MSLPYFPMYPTDFEADTSHLSLAEDGAYNRLLRLCWMTAGCSVPADQAWVMRRMKAQTKAEKQAVSDVLAEFFVVKKGRYVSPRLQKEWTAANGAHKKRVLAGKKGGAAKALNNNKKDTSKAVAKPYQPEPEPEPYKKEETKVSSTKKRGARLADDWVLPRNWGEWAVSEGFDADTIRLEADKFKDYWTAKAGKDGVKLDWLATWRNWMRNSNVKPNHNTHQRQAGRPSPHGTLHSAFGAVGGYDDGGSAESSGDMRDVTPSGEARLDCGPGFDASQPFLRVINE